MATFCRCTQESLLSSHTIIIIIIFTITIMFINFMFIIIISGSEMVVFVLRSLNCSNSIGSLHHIALLLCHTWTWGEGNDSGFTLH